ncbi:Activity-regulated cytoskeleton associated protein 2 [Eumeta japonica]|uniref:Activity-regulated cytoskeleton associated protein 2 n=1 Tax=Eumeta variegata TaxID=151549 RepID=A0A4C1SNU5_EUMVA|nr:Activity-regulated cytoskeleton associated protein 2 [Eumeta japonica]
MVLGSSPGLRLPPPSDRLVGGTTVPVSDLRDGADSSPCHAGPIVFLYNHYGTGAERRWNDLADPGSAALGSPFCSAASARSGSFAKCTARFDGSASDPDVLETFLDAIEVYKECLNINDEHALRGLPILLTGNAAVWWRGIKSTVSTWPDAVYKLRSMYGVPRPAHKILGIFSLGTGFRARRYIHYASSRAFAKLPYELSGAADRVLRLVGCPPAASSGRRAPGFIAQRRRRPSMSHAASSRVTPPALDTSSAVSPGVHGSSVG